MTILIAGLVLFLGIHLLPSIKPLRNGLHTAMGAKPYKLVFTLVSFVGLILIIVGFGRAPFEHVYAPFPWARGAAHAVMPIVFILLAAANMPGKIRQTLRHPMLIGVLLWSGVHLAANGDARSIALFGSFGAYALIALITASIDGRVLPNKKPVHPKFDGMAIGGGLILYAIVMFAHPWLFGVAVTG